MHADGQVQGRNPHCKDDRFEEKTASPEDVHVDVQNDVVAENAQVVCAKDGDPVDDDDLVVLSAVLQEDEGMELCMIEFFEEPMHIRT